MEEKKNNKGLIIVIIIFLIISLIASSYFIYKMIYLGETTTSESSNSNEKESNKEDKITLDEDDVRDWLEKHSIINGYFVLAQENFDSSVATLKEYGSILGWNLMFGGLYPNAIENTTLDHSSGYDYQYTYSIDFIKNLLNDYFGVGIDKIDTTIMNESFKGYANFSMDNNKFVMKVVATGADIYTTSEINTIKLNDDNEIEVEYNLYDMTASGDKGTLIEKRIIVLRKTNNGYNLLKSYKEN